VTQIEISQKIYLISACIWMLVWVLAHLSVMRFIVSRYEEETGLIDTVYFKKLMPFARNLPSLWSSVFYYMHLLFFFWLWRWIQNAELFNDIDNREQVTGKFSKKEIWLVNLDLASMILAAIHLVLVSYIFK
jgi:hypothetical protein